MIITFEINKQDVYEEIAKTTAYTGKKMDDSLYEKIFTTDSDKEMLQRFWLESKTTICQYLKKVLESEIETNDIYTLTLNVSSAFDTSLQDSMLNSLYSFFVMNITAKWFNFTNKAEAAGIASEAATYLDDIKRKACYKIKPTRPVYNNLNNNH